MDTVGGSSRKVRRVNDEGDNIGCCGWHSSVGLPDVPAREDVAMTLLEKLVLLAVVFLFGASGGWLAHVWKTGYEEKEAVLKASLAYQAAAKRMDGLSADLQVRVEALGSKRLTSTKETFHETTKVEYRCVLPESGRLLYNRAAAETAATSQP